jgi:serine/threonine protein kinase
MKTNKHRKVQRKRKIHTRRRHGGNVIGSGGYGCVFRPALKCKGRRKRSSKSISKLMLVKHAKREYSGIMKYLPILQKIPHYTRYFILEGANLCHPAPLTKADLSNFNLNCKPLKKRNITLKNINQSLDKVYSLNLPDGGIELGEYIDSALSIDEMQTLNTHMIELLVHGILPMNKLHIYHADIKESNMLVDMHTINVRLIDWGLSTYTTGNSIPDIMRDKPFQYNLPFSIVLFNNTFKTMYADYLSDADHSINNDSISVFLKTYVDKWIHVRGLGHMSTITSVWKLITNNKDLHVHDDIIIPYLTAVLAEYTRNGQFDMIGYFKNVFLKLIDLWGFIMSYSAFLETETGFDNHKINNLIITYLFKTPVHNIVIDNLITDLNNLF